MNEIFNKILTFLKGDFLEFILFKEVGFVIISSIAIICLTGVIKLVFRNKDVRKRLTPIVSLILGLGLSAVFYLVLQPMRVAPENLLNIGVFADLSKMAAFGSTLAVSGTGLYIFIKRVFGKKTNEQAMEDLLSLVEKALPKGLALVSAVSTGELKNTEEIYINLKKQIIGNLKKGMTEVDTILKEVSPYIAKATNNKVGNLNEKARELVDFIIKEVQTDVKVVKEIQDTQDKTTQEKLAKKAKEKNENKKISV